MIRLEHINVSFRSERQNKVFGVNRDQILFDLSLDIPKNCCLGILGESGSGKSTMGRVLCGLLKPDSGDVYINGKSVYRSKEGKKELQKTQYRFSGLYNFCKSEVSCQGYHWRGNRCA